MRAVNNIHTMRLILDIHRFIYRFPPLLCGLLLLKLLVHQAEGREIQVTLWPRPSSFSKDQPSPDKHLQTEMKKYLGVRYRLGGATTKGMDCSGFVRRVYANNFGIELPHNASEQSSLDILAKVSKDELKTGDLIFFSSNKKKKRITHVGIYLSDSNFIHAALKKGITVSSLDDGYWKSRLVSTKRLVDLENGSDTEITQPQGGFEFFLDENSAFRIGYLASDYSPFGVNDDGFNALVSGETYALSGLSGEHPRIFELSYSRNLRNDTWSFQVSAFREEFPVRLARAEYALHPIQPGHLLAGDHSDSVYRQGIRMASDITPFQWLRITPSFAYFDYGPGVDESDLPRRSFGIEVQLASLAAGWSLSTSLQYSDQKDFMARLFDSSSTGSAVDMSLTFRHQVTDYLQISFMGQHAFKATPSLEDTFQTGNRAEKGFFFTLGFSY